jgi:hypothetical protein
MLPILFAYNDILYEGYHSENLAYLEGFEPTTPGSEVWRTVY